MISRFLLLLAAGFALLGHSVAASPREQLFNDGWRFMLGDQPGAEKNTFRDEGWRSLDLPHDWSIEGEFSQSYASATGYLPGGIGWYRKHFTLPPETSGKRVFLRFEGVYRHSEVWFNGVCLGQRPNGYIDFEYDLTAHLRPPGEENVVAVRVARENVADSRWYTGTGIYRDTWLTVTNPIHVVRHGVFITTPVVDDEDAEVNSSCEVRNDSAADAEVTVTATVFDADQNKVGTAIRTQWIAAGKAWEFPLFHPVAKPRRWDVNDPYLYRVVHSVAVNGQVVDETSTPLGIRTFRFDADEGFFLNGRNLLIKGVCIHHDAGNTGAAVPRAVLERRLRILKSIGVNAIRCSHNPMADDFYELCDELGFLVMDEAFDEWEIGKRKWVQGRNVGTAERFGYSADFSEWSERDVEDTVRRARSHPSVILYSIGNEIDYPTDPYVHPRSRRVEIFEHDPRQPSMTRLAIVAPRLIAAAKRQDPTRPVTMALSNAPAANATGLAAMLDVAGYNYQEDAYDADHARFPGRVIYGSENGHALPAWLAVRDKPFISAQFLWTGFDFLGEADTWPRHGSAAGLFDTAGFAKLNALRREALWSDKPVLHLQAFRSTGANASGRRRGWGPSHWNEVPGETAPASVTAFTNLQEVTLWLNDRVIGTTNPDAGVARWSVPWEKGILKVTGKTSSGEAIGATLESNGPPAEIRLVTDRTTLAADGRDAVHVTITLVDAERRPVAGIEKDVTVEVTGPARVLALESGNLSDNTPPKSVTRSTLNSRALAIIQSAKRTGPVTVRVSAEGLPPAEIELATH